MSAQQFFFGFGEQLARFGWPLAALFAILVARQVLAFDRDTRVHAMLMFAYFFLVIAAFWMLKPVKKALLLAYYADGMSVAGWTLSAAQVELLAKEANMVIAFVAALLFSLLARGLRRDSFAAAVTLAFALLYALFALAAGRPSAFLAWSFYLAGDLFVTAMVAAFFAFLNDSEDPLAARRLYGLIGLGGVLGGAFGASVVAQHTRALDLPTVAGIAAALSGAILLLALGAGRIVARHPPQERDAGPSRAAGLQAAFAGAALTLRSRYLLAIAATVGIYEMVSTLLDYQFTATVLREVATDELGAYFSSVFAFTNVVAVAVQLLLTPWMLRRLGVGPALMLLPALLALCAAGFWAAPVLLVGSLLNTADNAFAYSLNQSAKEILYVPLSRDGKYRAKAFIDIFVLRLAKALAIVAGLALSAAFAGPDNLRTLSLLVLALLCVWGGAVRVLAREYRTHESRARTGLDSTDRARPDSGPARRGSAR